MKKIQVFILKVIFYRNVLIIIIIISHLQKKLGSVYLWRLFRGEKVEIGIIKIWGSVKSINSPRVDKIIKIFKMDSLKKILIWLGLYRLFEKWIGLDFLKS
jgi:hypothetical protein